MASSSDDEDTTMAEIASNSDRDPPLDCDSPLQEVATAITEFVGDLDTHALNLEEVKKDIGKEIRALDRPSIAFKLIDLQTLVHRVLIKVRSYTRTCEDVKELVSINFEEELESLEEMLDFLSETKSFSYSMKEELSAITKAIEVATTAVKEQKDANEAAAKVSGDPVPPAPSEATSTQLPHTSLDADNSSQPQASPTYQQTCQASCTYQQTQQSTFQRLSSMIFGHNSPEQERQRAQKAILDQCAKRLKELAVEVERIETEVVEKYSRNIIASLEKYESVTDTEELSVGIGEIRKVCAPSMSVAIIDCKN
ncbi:hypothetical protein GBAR_LOCUS5526 [Geodia barretti]|uniref:Uncharacterized protein n=1 Tax=Geodia barretti TaxID=519541 RepID=A0AA35W4M9_GEOBA|nr:hypothetical protein GBAR_LOCUS5526 [Geodia barretti]